MVRFKNRYITVEIGNGKSNTQPLKLNSPELYNAIVNKVKSIHGIYGFTAIKPGLKVIYCNELTRIAILRVRHGPHTLVLSVFPFIFTIKNINCSLKILYIGATLHHCYKAILSYQRNELCNLLPELKVYQEKEIISNIRQLQNIH